MERAKNRWKQLPDKPRRVMTFILGVLLIIAAGLIGWLPGPGGTIVFLLGIAVLATEFEWAARLRDWALDLLQQLSAYLRRHRFLTVVLIGLVIGMASISAYVFYTHIL